MNATKSWRAAEVVTARPIAHRGRHDFGKGIVENTASAFAAAIIGGYPIECDLQLTRDGEAVVFHDDHLDRLTEGHGLVKNISAADMQALTIRNSQDRVQTLAELLAQVRGQVPLIIELKSNWDGDVRLAERAIEVLKGYDGPCCLMSFDPDMIAAVRRLSPATIRGIVAKRCDDPYYGALPLARQMELRTFSHISRTRPDFVSFQFEELPWAPITALRSSGVPVISWTIRTPEQAVMARRCSDQITFEGFPA
ncbi:glycerophosphodiester phosphodiesterase family protein [Aestuariivirga sp.]|uniref:glycerophosphodiester phosphodiesterase family protein n=1 Tax=Aestuariivirga sp. TaxID=2650926 RepID=UPI0025C0B98F|nr:glycerophosphodiester phosphodiesterase family protein [Aestuariivirga sp.]MCA3556044.1 glycerophosphodiester phosphodiesterase [Aestuariivirga sp.]